MLDDNLFCPDSCKITLPFVTIKSESDTALHGGRIRRMSSQAFGSSTTAAKNISRHFRIVVLATVAPVSDVHNS